MDTPEQRISSLASMVHQNSPRAKGQKSDAKFPETFGHTGTINCKFFSYD